MRSRSFDPLDPKTWDSGTGGTSHPTSHRPASSHGKAKGAGNMLAHGGTLPRDGVGRDGWDSPLGGSPDVPVPGPSPDPIRVAEAFLRLRGRPSPRLLRASAERIGEAAETWASSCGIHVLVGSRHVEIAAERLGLRVRHVRGTALLAVSFAGGLRA